MIGGGQSESLDPNVGPTEVDVFRNRAIFEGIVEFGKGGQVVNQLAEEFTPNKDASIWTIKLRKGILWHDGKPLTADDVVYTFKYFLDPKNKSLSSSLVAPTLRPSGIRKIDSRTVQLHLTKSHSLLPQVYAERTVKIFQNGATAAQLGSNPIGTGPFMFKSWKRGERSLFVRNPHWFARGAFGPTYVDSLEIIAINQPVSRVNALAAGQVDMASDIGAKLASTVAKNSKLTLVEGASAAFTEFYMDMTADPFKDNRVRTAFKLMTDRKQMVANALAGHGRLGNDLPSWFDPNYARSLPQRQHDPEQAKALLKAAGKEGLTVELVTADFAVGALESATLLVGQAKQAGVNLKLKTIPGDQYYSTYPRTPFAQSNWGGRPFVPFAQYAFVPGAPDNETRFSNGTFNNLFFAALKTTNPARRKELLVEAQKLLWNTNGYIIWGFPNGIDATSAKVKGLTPSPIRPLNYYDVTHVYFA